jgi:hypothetical protein
MAVIDRTHPSRKGPPPYAHQAWPSWRYSAECPDGQIFQSEDEVPEGWVDHPAKIGKPQTKTFAGDDVADDDATVEALVEKKQQKDLVDILEKAQKKDSAIEFLANWPKLKLAKTIVAHGISVKLED